MGGDASITELHEPHPRAVHVLGAKLNPFLPVLILHDLRHLAMISQHVQEGRLHHGALHMAVEGSHDGNVVG